MMTDQNSTIRSLLRSGQVLEIGAQTHVRHENSSSSRGAGPRLILAFAAIYLIWGSTYLAIRFAVESIPPLLMMGGAPSDRWNFAIRLGSTARHSGAATRSMGICRD